MVKFRCQVSGNVVSFDNQDDIDSMRKETGYQEIVSATEYPVVDADKPALPDQTNKPRGRPRKGN